MLKKLEKVYGEESYKIASKKVELCVTRKGGQMSPVYFNLGNRKVCPYSLPPWEPDEADKGTPPLLKILRGDFFCLPFGESKGFEYPHGESANLNWRSGKIEKSQVILEMKVKNPSCKVKKILTVNDAHRAVYQNHIISGLQGNFSYGHHAIIQFPEDGKKYFINTSPFTFGSVKPDAFTDPAKGEYSALKTGARFRSLTKVPLASGGITNLQEYPDRGGFEDLIMVSSVKSKFAWTAVTLDGYIWISLKDPKTLPSTLFWMTNGGRHYAPWNGRHKNRIGLEEVNNYYCDGLELSKKDLLKKEGVSTSKKFSSKKEESIKSIHVVHPVPKNFGLVTKVIRDRKGEAIIVSNATGQTVTVPVNWKFLE